MDFAPINAGKMSGGYLKLVLGKFENFELNSHVFCKNY